MSITLLVKLFPIQTNRIFMLIFVIVINISPVHAQYDVGLIFHSVPKGKKSEGRLNSFVLSTILD